MKPKIIAIILIVCLLFAHIQGVYASTGYVAIETIKAGDKILSSNHETVEQAVKTVVQTFVNETEELVHVTVNGETITTTPEHPFYVPQKGWTGAIHLRAGDMLVLSNGEYVVVEKVEHKLLESPVKVYNFEVEDFHTYYVSEFGVLVHNACNNPGGRHGETKHRTKIRDVKDDLISDGWDVTERESRVYLKNGKYRYPDITATKDGVTRYYQIGKKTVLGNPIAREQRAINDLMYEAINPAETIFVPYN